MIDSSQKLEKQREGKADGLSFAACVLRGWVLAGDYYGD